MLPLTSRIWHKGPYLDCLIRWLTDIHPMNWAQMAYLCDEELWGPSPCYRMERRDFRRFTSSPEKILESTGHSSPFCNQEKGSPNQNLVLNRYLCTSNTNSSSLQEESRQNIHPNASRQSARAWWKREKERATAGKTSATSPLAWFGKLAVPRYRSKHYRWDVRGGSHVIFKRRTSLHSMLVNQRFKDLT